MDATVGSLLVHAADVTVTKPPLAADAVKVSEPPGSSDGVRGAIDAESGVTGGSVLLPRLRGVGAPAVKSAPLLLVSWRPSSLRRAAVVLVNEGVGAPPSEQFAPLVPVPYPT